MKTNEAHKGEIVEEDGYLYYYQDGVPTHAGVVQVDGKLYYAGREGELVCGHHKAVHTDRANGLVKRGTYEFDEDGVLIEASYQKPVRATSKRRKKGISKRAWKVLCAALAILVVLAIGLALYLTQDRTGTSAQTPESAAAQTTGDAGPIELPPVGETVWLVSPSLQAVYDGTATLQGAVSHSDNSPIEPYRFRYSMAAEDRAVLTLAGQSWELDPQASVLEIYNLETGRRYDYTVTVSGDWGSRTLDGSFEAADSNRFVRLDGVVNTRDVGGYETLNGMRVRQGVLIRGGELDGLVEPSYFLEDPAQAEPFHFRYDCDLRSGSVFTGVYASRLGEDVTHKFFTAPQYGQVFQAEYFAALRDLFAELADANHYPMYLHCTYGADRTGTLVFLLQGILGVPEEQMRFEYCLSGFTFPQYVSGENLNVLINGVSAYPGDTLNEKIEAFLTQTVGVPAEQLDSIRAIFLE